MQLLHLTVLKSLGKRGRNIALNGENYSHIAKIWLSHFVAAYQSDSRFYQQQVTTFREGQAWHGRQVILHFPEAHLLIYLELRYGPLKYVLPIYRGDRKPGDTPKLERLTEVGKLAGRRYRRYSE